MDKTDGVRGLGAGLAFIVPMAIILNLTGAVVCKYLAASLGRWIVVIALLAALGFVCVARTLYWIWVGKKWQLSFLYPVLSVSYLFSFLIGIWLFHESYSMLRLVGSLVIVAGVAITSLSRNRTDH